MRTESLLSSQSCHSVDADARCKHALKRVTNLVSKTLHLHSDKSIYINNKWHVACEGTAPTIFLSSDHLIIGNVTISKPFVKVIVLWHEGVRLVVKNFHDLEERVSQ